MKRALFVLLVLVGIAAVGWTYWMARRPLRAARTTYGGPPPGALIAPKSRLGERAPDFSGVDQTGHEFSLSSLRGRVVVVDVWASWCQPCVQEMPRIENEIWRRFQKDGAMVVGVARGEDAAKIRAFNKLAALTFPLIPDPKVAIARRFGADRGIPQTFVIDRAGVIVYQTLGYDPRHFDRLAAVVQRSIDRH